MSVFPLLALVFTQTSGLETPISVTMPQASMGEVAKRLESFSGVHIEIEGGPEKDWIYLKVKDRPLREVLDALAELCDADWKGNGQKVKFKGVWETAAQLESQRASMISDWLDRRAIPPAVTSSRAKEIINSVLASSQNGLPTKQKELNELFQATPLPRAIYRLLRHIGPQELSRIPEGEEKSFALFQRGRCEKLDASTESIFADIAKESDVFQGELLKAGLTYENVAARGMMPASFFFYFSDLGVEFWVLKIGNLGDELNVQLQGFSGKNESMRMVTSITVGSLAIDDSVENDGLEVLKDQFHLPQDWIADLEPGRLSNQIIAQGVDVPTMHLSSAYEMAGQLLDMDVAAIVPDGGFISASQSSQKTSTLGQVIKRSMQGNAALNVSNGVAIMRPRNLRVSRRSRIERQAFREFVLELSRLGRANLEMAADLAVAIPDDLGLEQANWMAMFAAGGRPVFQAEPALLRIYGGLSKTQRTHARETGLYLPYSKLSPGQKSALNHLVNSVSSGIATPVQELPLRANTYSSGEAATETQLTVPHFIPAETPILVRVGAEKAYFAMNSRLPGAPPIEVTPRSYGHAKALGLPGLGDVDRFCSATVSSLQVAINLGSVGYFSRSSPPDNTPSIGGTWVTLSQMPEEFQREVKEGVGAGGNKLLSRIISDPNR